MRLLSVLENRNDPFATGLDNLLNRLKLVDVQARSDDENFVPVLHFAYV